MRAPFLVLGSCALAILAGCVSPPADPAADADVSAVARSGTNATGIVVVEGSSSNEGARADAVARFVRARSGAVDDDALRMVGARVEFPAIGGCGALGSAHPAASGATSSSSSAITLLDVGAVTLVAGEDTSTTTGASLEPRQLPDVADLVSGVVYSTPGRDGVFPAKSPYVLRVEGSADSEVPAFSVNVASPGEPADVRIAGDDGRSGPVAIALGAPVDLRWEAGQARAAGEPGDLIYVDLAATAAAPTTRCLFVDSGQAKIDASDFGALEEGTIAVHRLHRESFRARGVDPGEVRFDFARVVSFVRR